MGNLARKFRIGEKISLGFGLVGCLFLIVVWRYHAMLEHTMDDYQRLLDVYVARLNYAKTIEHHILSARLAEKNFIVNRRPGEAESVAVNTDAVKRIADRLAKLDDDDKPVANRIRELVNNYQLAFNTLTNATQVKGLDYNSGLQGAFRNSAHELEAMAAQFETSDLYVLLLQIRRGEKDLGLRREDRYRVRVEQLLRDLRVANQQSSLSADTKGQLSASIEAYTTAFADYADQVLNGNSINGGRGPFRDIAHSIETLVNLHFVPKLKADILQLRRREKDYLLRGEQRYIDMVNQLITAIADKAEASGIKADDKQRFADLLADYERNFSALVQQNDTIAQVNRQMEAAVSGITSEVENNVATANSKKLAMVNKISETSTASERQLLVILLVAILAGVFFSALIIRGISRPLLRMVSILDQLSHEETTERMPHVVGGRDEVNAMAGSVNTMADHRHQFIQWWQASMAESEALQELHSLEAKSGGNLAEVNISKRHRAEDQVTATAESKRELLLQQLAEVENLNEQNLQQLEAVLAVAPKRSEDALMSKLHNRAKAIKTTLGMVLFGTNRGVTK